LLDLLTKTLNCDRASAYQLRVEVLRRKLDINGGCMSVNIELNRHAKYSSYIHITDAFSG